MVIVKFSLPFPFRFVRFLGGEEKKEGVCGQGWSPSHPPPHPSRGGPAVAPTNQTRAAGRPPNPRKTPPPPRWGAEGQRSREGRRTERVKKKKKKSFFYLLSFSVEWFYCTHIRGSCLLNFFMNNRKFGSKSLERKNLEKLWGTPWKTCGKLRGKRCEIRGFPQKKVLSLVLCVAVMLSVMVMGAGAAFSDQTRSRTPRPLMRALR